MMMDHATFQYSCLSLSSPPPPPLWLGLSSSPPPPTFSSWQKVVSLVPPYSPSCSVTPAVSLYSLWSLGACKSELFNWWIMDGSVSNVWDPTGCSCPIKLRLTPLMIKTSSCFLCLALFLSLSCQTSIDFFAVFTSPVFQSHTLLSYVSLSLFLSLKGDFLFAVGII